MMDVKMQDVQALVIIGYTSWKWYTEWRKEKERSQAKRGKRKARKRSHK